MRAAFKALAAASTASLCLLTVPIQSQNIVEKANALVSVGVFPFNDDVKDEKLENGGAKVAALIDANLSKQSDIMLVDRQEINKIIAEQSLNISGMANPDYANKVGYLLGARIIVTGSIFKIDKKTVIVAKIIGAETSRVFAEKVDGMEPLDALVDKLSISIAQSIKDNGSKLLPVYRTRTDVINAINERIGSAKKPSVYVNIPERHVQAQTVDPAAQTEFNSILKDCGFEVLEKPEGADVVLKGEAFSETGIRRGELIGVKARLEVKAVDKAGKVIAAERQTAVCVDVVEQMAGKEALQTSASLMAAKLLPKIAQK